MSNGTPNAAAKWSRYEIDGDGKLVRKAEFCPRCGPGVFLGEHKDRHTCGRCGHSVKKE